MATVTNWIDHLSASEVQGAVYPGVGTEGILVLVGRFFGLDGMWFQTCKSPKK